MSKRMALLSAIAVMVLTLNLGSNAEEKAKQELKLKDIECMFCKMDVIKDAAVEYKGAQVFFGCAGCPEAFKQNPKKFATKANAQLVATKQARQKACPISGKPHKADIKLDVAKAEVSFCCSGCKDATAKLAKGAQVEKLFNEKAFKVAFEVPKAKKN